MRRTLFLIPVVFLSAAVAAQEGFVLTEDEFLSVLNSDHPAALALAGDLGRAEAKRRQAALLENPSLDFLREEPGDFPRETVWGLAWTPPLDGRRGLSIQETEAGLEAERASIESQLNSLRFELRGIFAAWTGGHTRVEILREHGERLDSLADRMRRRADAGEESLLDARRLEMAVLTSKAALSDARVLATRAGAEAVAWLSAGQVEPPIGVLELRPELPGLPEDPGEVDSTLRPDLAVAAFRVEEAEAAERLSKRGIAAPKILLGWKTIEGPMSDFQGPVFGVSWAVPLFDRRQADRLTAERALNSARAENEWISRRVASDLAAARDSYTELRGSALSAADSLRGLGDVATAATASYEQGESTVTDLLDTLRAVAEARLSALELYLAALTAHRQLEFATGRSLTAGGLS